MTQEEIDKLDKDYKCLSSMLEHINKTRDAVTELTVCAQQFSLVEFEKHKEKFITVFEGLKEISESYFEYVVERRKIVEKAKNEEHQTK